MSEDLELAAKVHYSFLPEDYEDNRVSISVTLRPLYPIGGDYCSILWLDENRCLISTCDAVGHGISAALFAARINTYVLTHAHSVPSTCDLVNGLNSYLCKRLGETGIYTSFYALLLDFKTELMTFTGAAHPPILQFEPGGLACREWPSIVTYLGITDPMPLVCGSNQVSLQSGHRFLLYSDGLIEAQRADEQLFGTDRLSSAVIDNSELSGQTLNQALLEQAESFTASGFSDDVLLMNILIK